MVVFIFRFTASDPKMVDTPMVQSRVSGIYEMQLQYNAFPCLSQGSLGKLYSHARMSYVLRLESCLLCLESRVLNLFLLIRVIRSFVSFVIDLFSYQHPIGQS